MENCSNNNRFFNLDLIRAVAICFVIWVHTFLYNGFYDRSVDNLYMFLSIFLRQLLFICVPLFVLLTGYLKINKRVNKDHYLKILPILISYFIISIITLFFRYFYLGETDIIKLIIDIFNFNTIGYAWYVEMYIGLFLLIPFLNILYKGLKKKEKLILIGSLVFISFLPNTLAMFEFSSYKLDVLPDRMLALWPICYYYVGCYIREYGFNIKRRINVLLIFGLILLQSFILFFYCYGSSFKSTITIYYNDLFTFVISILVFGLLLGCSCKNKVVVGAVKRISLVSFYMYLFSFIFDSIFYPLIGIKGWKCFFISSLVIVLSFSCSYVYYLIYSYIKKKKGIKSS